MTTTNDVGPDVSLNKRVRGRDYVVYLRAIDEENGERLVMTPLAASLNRLIRDDLDDRVAESDEEDEEDAEGVITVVPGVSTELLKVIVTYCERRALDPPRPVPGPNEGDVTEWLDAEDKAMCEPLSFADLFRLVEAANFLGNDSLTDAVAAYFASRVADKTPKQIRTMLGIAENYTHEDEEFVRANTKSRAPADGAPRAGNEGNARVAPVAGNEEAEE